MTQDHDDLDFDAWEAPVAPDVTDAVIANARVPMSTATETVDTKRSHRSVLLAGGAIVLSVAAILIAVMIDRSKQPPPAPSLADLRVEELEKKVDELEAAIEKLNAIGTDPEPASAPTPAPAPPPAPTPKAVEDRGPPPAACDAAALTRQGKEHYGKALWGAALAAFEEAFACQQTKESALLAAMSACKSGRATEAKKYFARVDEQRQPSVVQTCLQKGIELGSAAAESSASDRKCDWNALHSQGATYYAKAQWSAALQAFEQAYNCKAAGETAMFAALSACKAHRHAAAFRWFKKTPEKKRAQVERSCIEAGTDLLIE